MRANHIPVTERLQRRIALLEYRADEAWYSKRGNPYRLCGGCDRATPDISVRGHARGCRVKWLENQIPYYRGLLAAVIGKAGA